MDFTAKTYEVSSGVRSRKGWGSWGGETDMISLACL